MSSRNATSGLRAKGLFVVRESDQYDDELFDAMRHQTYVSHDKLPEVAAVMGAGLEPLSGRPFTVVVNRPDGGVEHRRVVPDVLRRGRTTAVLFEVGGYWHLWSQASAATETSGVNEITDILVEQTERLRPVTVYAAGISRLIRSQRQGNLLSNAFDGNVDVVVTGEAHFQFAGSTNAVRMGRFAFSMLCQIAAWERDWIVQRLLAGRISKWRRDEWPFGVGAVPFGYTLESSGRLVPVPELKEQVGEMLRILSRGLPSYECIKQLDALGIVSARERLPYGELKSPGQLVQGIYAWAGLYCLGEFLLRQRNVFPGFKELNGLTIMRHPFRDDAPSAGAAGVHDLEATGLGHPDDEVLPEDDMSDDGEFQMLYQVGVPDGGWADPQTLDAFANAAIARFAASPASTRRPLSPDVLAVTADGTLHMSVGKPSRRDRRVGPAVNTGARSRQTISLLTGRSWEEGEWVYELNASTPARYAVSRRRRTRPANTAGREILARIPADELIQGFVRAFIVACREGVAARKYAGADAYVRTSGVPHKSQEEVLAAFRSRIEVAERQSARATANELATEDPADRNRYREAARASANTKTQLEARLAQLLERSPEVAPGDRFDAYTGILLPALKRLQACGGRVTQLEYQAFNKLVPRLELVRRGALWCARAWVRIRTVEGVAELGPIEWQVGAGGIGTHQVRGRGAQGLPSTMGRGHLALRRSLRQAGLTNEAAITLANSPFPELPHTVLHRLTGNDPAVDIGPEWTEPGFSQWVTAVYLDPGFRWRGSGRHTRLHPLRQLLAYYAADHTTFTPEQAFQDLPVAFPHAVTLFSRASGTGLVRPIQPVLTKVDGGKGKKPLLSGVRCACGEVATVMARVPEIPRDLLCECGWMPDANSHGMPHDVRFPHAYLSLQLSREDALALTRADYETRRNGPLTTRDERVLRLLSRTPGLTDVQLREELTLGSTLHQSLRRLEGYGYIFHDGQRPKQWHVTAAGRSRL